MHTNADKINFMESFYRFNVVGCETFGEAVYTYPPEELVFGDVRRFNIPELCSKVKDLVNIHDVKEINDTFIIYKIISEAIILSMIELTNIIDRDEYSEIVMNMIERSLHHYKFTNNVTFKNELTNPFLLYSMTEYFMELYGMEGYNYIIGWTGINTSLIYLMSDVSIIEGEYDGED